MGVIETKVFKSGNSAAVRLPKALGLPAGTAVTIARRGDVVTIRPVSDPAEGRKRMTRLIAKLEAIGPVGDIERREPIEFPDRPGLY